MKALFSLVTPQNEIEGASSLDGSRWHINLLGFGLAKVFEGEFQAATDLSHSPTLIKVTQAGMILGQHGLMIRKAGTRLST